MGEEFVQWNFDDLLSPPREEERIETESKRKVYSVEELTSEIKSLLEKKYATLWVTGEVSGLRLQSSGHCYFTLKDTGAQIQCVLFKGTRGANRKLIEDGKKLTLQGEISLYELRGQYQLIVRQVEEEGIGKLAAEFEKLKKLLQAEGLFSPERKRPIPLYPRRVGIVTSPTGAALQDILKVFRNEENFLEVDVVLAPSKVQGEGASADIVKAIELLNIYHVQVKECEKLDLILVTRGGGSTEDLWCFNEEKVARAIAASALPVISAVGHEIDFCISDFVADHRSATPTAAAEFIIQNLLALREELKEGFSRMTLWAKRSYAWAVSEVENMSFQLSILSPQKRVEDFYLRLDDNSQVMGRIMQNTLNDCATEIRHLKERILGQRPADRLTSANAELLENKRRICEGFQNYLNVSRSSLDYLKRSLELLDPKTSLKRGYSITIDASSKGIIKSKSELVPGKNIITLLKDGSVESVVKEEKDNGLDSLFG
jgi:exodeoxyribonuclease VII large subunit